MAAKTVLNYLPRESVIHKLTGTTKLAFFLLFTFASMITYNTWVLLVLLAVSLAAFKLSRIRFREVRFMLVFMLVFLLLNNLFIFLFDPDQGTTLYGTRTVLCHLFWRYDLTAEQLFYMCNISLKYFVALPVAILFISATDPSEFAASLNSIGISYKVGYSVAIALRYIPARLPQHQPGPAGPRRGAGQEGTLLQAAQKLRQHPAAAYPDQPEPHRHHLQCDGTARLWQKEQAHLVHPAAFRPPRSHRAGCWGAPAAPQPHRDHPVRAVLQSVCVKSRRRLLATLVANAV